VDGLAAGVDVSVGVGVSLGALLADGESAEALSLGVADAEAAATGPVSATGE